MGNVPDGLSSTQTLPAPDAPCATTELEAVLARLPERFVVERVLGRGAMGLVVAAHDRRLGREVAVKLVLLDAHDRPRARLFQEAQAAARLSHPNIVQVHEVDDDGCFLVMELVGGASLGERLAQGPLPPDRIRAIGREMLDALHAAHEARIVHRDVKPSNVLLAADGSVRLADFGIARLPESELTSTGEVLGTLGYMAPEQLRGVADARSDVYAAGATLFRAATGLRAHEAGDADQVRRALAGALHDTALARAIAKALEIDPANRWPSAAAFRDALATPRGGAPRRALVTALVTALGAALLLALLATAFLARDAPEAAPVAAADPPPLVAVPPFEDRTADVDLAFSRTALPYVLATELTRAAGIETLGAHRLAEHAGDEHGPSPPWQHAARSLGATHIARGEIDPDGEGARVRITLLRASGEPTATFERSVPRARLATTVRDMALGVASSLRGSARSGAPSEAPSLAVELARAEHALGRNALAEAEDHVARAMALDPDDPRAHYHATMIAWWRGQGADVVAGHAERARAGLTSGAERALLEGVERLARGDNEDALERFRRAYALGEGSRELHYGLFEALFHSGLADEAMEIYRQHLAGIEGSDLGLDHVLDRACAAGDEALATRAIRRAEEVDHTSLPQMPARARMARGDYAGAAELLSRMTEAGDAQTATSPTIRLLAIALLVRGQPDLAELVADQYATTLTPTDAGLVAAALATLRDEDALLRAAHRDRARRTLDARPSSRAAWLRLLTLELAEAEPDALPDIIAAARASVPSDVRMAMVELLAARRTADDARVASARASLAPEVRAAAEAITAERAGEPRAAADAWARAARASADGTFLVLEHHARASALRALGEHDELVAACEEVVTPRVFAWAWAALVGPCLEWTAEAHEARGRSAPAHEARRRLATLRRRG
ncbi:MAG: protein kinase [Sandaracinaceae bacterium]|nr:protein kinase [Sandaracinaceae bacterium]